MCHFVIYFFKDSCASFMSSGGTCMKDLFFVKETFSLLNKQNINIWFLCFSLDTQTLLHT